MQRAFTLIELLVVVAIIGILSAVVLLSIQEARARAEDSRRIQDLKAVETALHLYYNDHGNYMETGSGCGSSGNGSGWFNYGNGTSYPTAMSKCLQNGGYTSGEIIDPTGAISANNTNARNHAYMKYSCTTGTYIYASLKTQPRFVDGPTNGTCCAVCDSSYGMNYYVHIQ